MQTINIRRHFLRLNRGFTLVELLMYMGLLSILVVILTQIFTTILDLQTETEATSSVERDSRFIISRLAYDVHRATAITAPAGYGGSSGSLTLTIGGIPHIYALDGTNLEVASDQEYKINSYATRISNLSFTKIGNGTTKDTVRVTFTLQSSAVEAGGQRETKTISTTIGLR